MQTLQHSIGALEVGSLLPDQVGAGPSNPQQLVVQHRATCGTETAVVRVAKHELKEAPWKTRAAQQVEDVARDEQTVLRDQEHTHLDAARPRGGRQ